MHNTNTRGPFGHTATTSLSPASKRAENPGPFTAIAIEAPEATRARVTVPMQTRIIAPHRGESGQARVCKNGTHWPGATSPLEYSFLSNIHHRLFATPALTPAVAGSSLLPRFSLPSLFRLFPYTLSTSPPHPNSVLCPSRRAAAAQLCTFRQRQFVVLSPITKRNKSNMPPELIAVHIFSFLRAPTEACT